VLRVVGPGIEAEVKVTFPPILEHDVAASVQAIVQAATLGNYQLAGVIDEKTITRMLLTALGDPDVEGVMERLEKEKEERATAAATNPVAATNEEKEPQMGAEYSADADNADDAEAEEAMARAAGELREAIGALVRKLEG
jgi:ribosomal protein L12E/L44/L45/RPP1/RPP2